MAEKSRDILVIGAGIAGIQCSLDLADMGFKVHLVERQPSIGGRMAQLDKTFPTNDCSICILSPKMADCARHPNIDLLTYSEVKEVNGEGGGFRVKIQKYARLIDEKKCVSCGDCSAKCPARVPDEFDMRLRRREAVYRYYLQGIPATMTIDREHCLHVTKGICGICKKLCTREAVDFEQKDTGVELSVRSIVAATGFEPFDPSGMSSLGYGRYRNVITALECERFLSASGPTGGHLLRPSDRRPVERLGFIQCVGSRDLRNSPYCSSVCCMHATKEAMLSYEHDPNLRSYVFYMDLRAVGKDFQKYVSRAEQQYNVTYLRGRVAKIVPDKDECPIIFYENLATSDVGKVKVDLAVLATTLMPSRGTAYLAKILGVELDEYGFIRTDPTSPLNTSRRGIFACGCCRGPVDIPEAVSQASAAAAKAAEVTIEA